MNINEYVKTIEAFAHENVLVVGDVMLDTYLWGEAERISPEAPVPVVRVRERQTRLGGAANVAGNIISLGAKAFLASVIGDDKDGEAFCQIANSRGIVTSAILKSEERRTTRKSRVFSSNQQIVRFDEEETRPIGAETENELLSRIRELLKASRIGVIVLQDYNKGVLTARLIREILQIAKESNIPTAVDPKKENFFAYEGCSLFKPNWREVLENIIIDNSESMVEKLKVAAGEIFSQLKVETVLITLASEGVFVSDRSGHETISAHKRNVADVSGAGDTVISVAALALTQEIGKSEMARLANFAGGLVCEEPGVVQVTREKLISEIRKLE